MLGHPVNFDGTYLRLDCANDPLTATLESQNVVPRTDDTYDLGSSSARYLDVFSSTAEICDIVGAGTPTVARTAGSSILGTRALAVSGATATLEIDAGGSVATMLGVVAWAAQAGHTCTVEITGTSGLNFGSAISVLAPAQTRTYRVTIAGSGNLNFGSCVPGVSNAAACTIDMTGTGCQNFGSCVEAGGAITMAGQANVNFMQLNGATCTWDTPASTIGAFAAGALSGSASVELGNSAFLTGQIAGRADIGASGGANQGNAHAAFLYLTSAASVININGQNNLVKCFATAGDVTTGSLANSNFINAQIFGNNLSITGSGNLFSGSMFDVLSRTASLTGNGNLISAYCGTAGAPGLQFVVSGNASIIAGTSTSSDFFGTSDIFTVSGSGCLVAGVLDVGNITASANGCIVGGVAVTVANLISATASGSIAWGDSTAGPITASASNAMQLGPGVNNLALSIKVGASGTGIWIIGGGAMGAAANGKIWNAGASGVQVRSNGVTIILLQRSTTGTATGFTAGGGTTVTHTSTFTGNTGATAYTIGDIVRALKQNGFLAA